VLLSRSFGFSFVLLLRWCECSALVTFVCVLCTLHAQISRSTCNFTHCSGTRVVSPTTCELITRVNNDNINDNNNNNLTMNMHLHTLQWHESGVADDV
jgi:hypothetical protein